MLLCRISGCVSKIGADVWVGRGTVSASPLGRISAISGSVSLSGRVSILSGSASLWSMFKKRLCYSDPLAGPIYTAKLPLFLGSLFFSHLLLSCIFSSLFTGGKQKDVKRPLLKNSSSRENSARLHASCICMCCRHLSFKFRVSRGPLADPFYVLRPCDSCAAALCFMVKRGADLSLYYFMSAVFPVLGKLRLHSITKRGPWFFFLNQTFPAWL